MEFKFVPLLALILLLAGATAETFEDRGGVVVMGGTRTTSGGNLALAALGAVLAFAAGSLFFGRKQDG